jgi:hypothetical protein
MSHTQLRPAHRIGWIAATAVAAAFGTAVAAGDHDGKGHYAAPGVKAAPEATAHTAPDDVQTPAPPFSEGIFPCSDCHKDMPVNTVRR